MAKIINKLSIQGIKGVLDRSGEFVLAKKKKPRSIVVFAPNGCGKSGYADAIEYLFSEDGCVDHLGKGGSDSEKGGKHALPHVLADDRGIEPKITISIQDTETGDIQEIVRHVKTGRSDDCPEEISNLVKLAPAHRVLRQHDLRRFVVEMSPTDKYSELSRWIGLTRFETILKHLTTTSNSLAEANKKKEIAERITDIKNATSEKVTQYDLPEIYTWCSASAEEILDKKQIIASWEDVEKIQLELEKKKEELLLASNESGKYKSKASLRKSLENLVEKNSSLHLCSLAITEAESAEIALQKAKEEAINSVFSEVWKNAKKLLDEVEYKSCPVCLTKWEKTEVGSQKSALVRLNKSIEGLKKYNDAEIRLKSTRERVAETLSQLSKDWQDIENKSVVLGIVIPQEDQKNQEKISDRLKKLQDSNASYQTIKNDFNKIGDQIQSEVVCLKKAVEEIQVQGIPDDVAIIDRIIASFSSLKDADERLKELQKQEKEYRNVEEKFNKIEEEIRTRIAELINNIIDEFKDDVTSIYKKIHPLGSIPAIYIRPDTITRTLILRIDFHEPGRTLPPAGYLSESYINSLGLALFISSVKIFNQSFPFIFLDDIVSSYDADHRGRIVDVIAESLNDFQVFLTTHDHMFYTMLRDRLIDKGWQFEKISHWDFEHGPEKELDSFSETEIEKLIETGQTKAAGNAVRQYIEDWLDKTCEKYQVHTIHRRNFKEYKRTLFDFWDPFMQKIMNLSGDFFANQIESEPCFDRLKTNPLLNYYSHAQSNPYEWPAIGDVQYIWIEFRAFQKLFHCASCGKMLNYSSDANRLFCTCGGAIFQSLNE
jgi:hypothetical protein